MLDDYSLSRTGVEWRNLASERKQNKSLSKFYMYNQTENENEKDLLQPLTLYNNKNLLFPKQNIIVSYKLLTKGGLTS